MAFHIPLGAQLAYIFCLTAICLLKLLDTVSGLVWHRNHNHAIFLANLNRYFVTRMDI